jgi:hypothetical protein
LTGGKIHNSNSTYRGISLTSGIKSQRNKKNKNTPPHKKKNFYCLRKSGTFGVAATQMANQKQLQKSRFTHALTAVLSS